MDGAFQARPISPELADEYFAQMESFEADKLRSMRRQRNGMAVITGLCAISVTMASYGIASLAPLKSVEPMVFTVDRTTGIVDRNTDLVGDQLTSHEAINRFFAATYVRGRESYVGDAIDDINRQVAALTTTEEYGRYIAWMKSPTGNPQKYSGTGKASIRIKVKSIALLTDAATQDKRGIMQVRFDRVEIRAGEDPALYWAADGGCIGRPNPSCLPWIATIHFEHAKGPMPESTRLRNPLGWLVTSYDSAAETK